jgi:hypothetical protein
LLSFAQQAPLDGARRLPPRQRDPFSTQVSPKKGSLSFDKRTYYKKNQLSLFVS